MRKALFIAVLSCVSLTLFGQIWNYPPEAFTTYKEYESLKMDKVKTFRAWKRERNEQGILGEFALNITQEFDSLGRMVRIVKGENTAEYLKFVNGYWLEGITNGEPMVQVLKFDENNNVIYRKFGNQVDSVVYDHLNRPVARYSTYESCFWEYKDGLLVSYTQKSDGETFEETNYFHDTINSTLSYKRCRYTEVGDITVESCDSTFAKFNEINEPTYIINIDDSWSEPDTVIMTVAYDEDHNVLGGMLGCQRFEFNYDYMGYRILARRYNCENELVHEEKFEYEFYSAPLDRSDHVNTDDLLVIYEFGAYFDSGSECEKAIRAKYGYKTEWGTCIATRRMLKNNAKVERKLKERHGRNWEETLKEEVRKCERQK